MYKIRRLKSIRAKTEWIIICHSVDLIKNDVYINNIVQRGTYKYTWGIWQEYFMHDLQLDDLPCHYFTELLDKDYVVYKGLADQKKSSFIEDLYTNGIIEYNYKNSILIVLQDNLNYEIPEQRMYDHLSNKIICQLLRQYKLDFTRVKILDECLTKDWELNMKNSKLKYEIIPHKYFNKEIMDLSILRYHNF